MNNDIYNGSSEGFNYLVNGYLDYSQEVIARRAIPDLRDGLKPVQRRILYYAKLEDKGQMQKCATFVANAMKLHPHGDSSVWGAMCIMVDSNGSWNMPVFKGMGNLGKVYSSAPPAAYRYPKAMLNKNANEYFKEKNILNLVQSEEGDGLEPEVLFPSYPTVLVNGTMGIAVSVGTKIPSFNFIDVLDLTIKHIKTGSLDPVNDIIYPDFPTGGVLVKSDSEVAKVMATGIGKLKIRAKVDIEGNEIVVNEVPFGKTFEGIVKAVENADIRDIKSVMNLTGNDSDGKVVIVCRSKKAVEGVLLDLYRMGILQNIFASNILVVNDGKPYMYGVHDIIKEWVKFRQGVIVKKFEVELQGIAEELTILDYFIRLISNTEWRDTYVSKATKESKKVADAYLHEIFPDIPDNVCTWINGRAISAFNRGGSYAKRFSELTEYRTYCNDMHDNPDKYIINELEELKKEYKGKCPRKTQISNTDYKFSKLSDSEAIQDTSYCVYTLTDEGFILKTREKIERPNILCQFEGTASDVLVGFDNIGRVLKISGAEIPFHTSASEGFYLPSYFGVTGVNEYIILYMCVCDGSRKMLVYRDGYIGYFDTEQWVGKKVMKIINKGVCTAVMDKLLQIYDEENKPNCLLFVDNSGRFEKLGIVVTKGLPIRSNLSRAKVFDGTNIDTKYIAEMSYLDVHANVNNNSKYTGRLGRYKEEDITGDIPIHEGFYTKYCNHIISVSE